MKMPQLRILATSFCGYNCLYCRPTGEGGISCATKNFININDALKICRFYKEYGGKEIKITGGDPVFWSDLVPFVKSVKYDIGIKQVEIITRNPNVINIIDDLIAAGIDILNFSLDTINKEIYQKITGCDNYDKLITAIRYCAKLVPLKINAVIMKDINDSEIEQIISFCEEIGVKQLKLLDIINDLQDIESGNHYRLQKFGVNYLGELYTPLTFICENIRKHSISEDIIYQGGLGHPMNKFKMKSGLTVIVKDSKNGAWYGSICKDCPSYPCHDALMALRLTSDNKLQYCLLNEKNSVSLEGLSNIEIATIFSNALKIYEEAHFIN